MKIFFILFCCALALFARSQRTVDVSKNDVTVGQNMFFSVGGEPFVNVKFVSVVSGTPYFEDKWMKGSVVATTGQVYTHLSLKLDLVDKEVHYLGPDKIEYVATTPLREVILNGVLDSFRFVHSSVLTQEKNSIEPGWYLCLYAGKSASLYSLLQKQIFESKPYGASAAEQSIETSARFFVRDSSSMREVKKIKDLPGMFPAKKSLLEDYLKNKDDSKAPLDRRFVAIIQYYNTLP